MGAVVVAARYVPRPPDDQPWVRKSYGPSLVLELASNLPFRPSFFRFNYFDQPNWAGQTFDVPLTITLPPAVVLPTGTPRRWEFDYDQQREWVGEPGSAFNLLSQTLQLYAPAPARNPPYAETPEWGPKSGTVNNLLLNAAITPPLVPSRWKFDYQDSSPGWVVESAPVPPVQKLVGGNFPFVPTRWKLDYDDPGVWRAAFTSVNRVIDLAFVPPFVPARWKLDYDEASVWYTKPGNIPDSYMPVGGGYPFAPQFWRYNLNDAGVWQNRSFGPSLSLELAANLPFVPPYWKYNNDDPGAWRGAPANVSIVQQLVIAAPLVPQRWAFNNDDPSYWVGSPVNVSVLITQPLPPPSNPEIHPVYHFANVGSMMVRL